MGLQPQTRTFTLQQLARLLGYLMQVGLLPRVETLNPAIITSYQRLSSPLWQVACSSEYVGDYTLNRA